MSGQISGQIDLFAPPAATIAWTSGPPATPGWYLLAYGQSLAGTPLVTFGTVTARDLPNWGDVLWHLRLPEIPA